MGKGVVRVSILEFEVCIPETRAHGDDHTDR